VSDTTVAMQFAAAAIVGTVAALVPAWRTARSPIVEGLRMIA
jgi:ABC-type lipoprotein release transport system permease subunit